MPGLGFKQILIVVFRYSVITANQIFEYLKSGCYVYVLMLLQISIILLLAKCVCLIIGYTV